MSLTRPLSFGCSSGPRRSGTCDLYMMNREGPRFRRVVLSWESSVKGLNSPFDAGMHDRAARQWKRPLSVWFFWVVFFLECVTAAGSRCVWEVPWNATVDTWQLWGSGQSGVGTLKRSDTLKWRMSCWRTSIPFCSRQICISQVKNKFVSSLFCIYFLHKCKFVLPTFNFAGKTRAALQYAKVVWKKIYIYASSSSSFFKLCNNMITLRKSETRHRRELSNLNYSV